MSGSAIAASLDGLVAVFTAVKPDGFDVGDGRPYDPKRKFLAVGWAGVDEAAVESSRTVGDAALSRDADTFDVINLLSVWSGKEIRPEVRLEAFAAFDTFDAALALNRNLSGAAMNARVTEMTYIPAFVVEGAMAQVRFVVTVRAFH